MQELDIREIFHIVKKHIWLILSITLFIFVLGVIYTFVIVTPQYEANTTLYVGRNIGNLSATDAIAYQDLLLGEELVNDYRELVKSRQVAKEVQHRLIKYNLEVNQIIDMVDVESKTNTRIIAIKATSDNKELSTYLANKMAEVFSEKAIEIMDVKNVQIIDMAIIPEKPITPNVPMNLAISLILGLMAGVGIVFLIEFLDNKIRTPEDVQSILGLPVLGVILSFDDESKFNSKIEARNKNNGGNKDE